MTATILSATAVGRLIERRVATYGPLGESETLDYIERFGVDRDRAERAIELACVRGRLVRTTGDRGPALRLPHSGAV